MQRSDQSSFEALQVEACSLLLQLHQAPDNVDRRAALINWIQQHPAHRQAFDSLGQSLEGVADLLEHV